jgi:hypothetical protein
MIGCGWPGTIGFGSPAILATMSKRSLASQAGPPTSWNCCS